MLMLSIARGQNEDKKKKEMSFNLWFDKGLDLN